MISGKKPHEIIQTGIARVFQTPEIFPDLTLLENVMIPAFAKREGALHFNAFRALSSETELRDEAMYFLEDLGLKDQIHNEAKSLSRGDKRRLELAMCLIQHPRLLLLDEPTADVNLTPIPL